MTTNATNWLNTSTTSTGSGGTIHLIPVGGPPPKDGTVAAAIAALFAQGISSTQNIDRTKAGRLGLISTMSESNLQNLNVLLSSMGYGSEKLLKKWDPVTAREILTGRFAAALSAYERDASKYPAFSDWAQAAFTSNGGANFNPEKYVSSTGGGKSTVPKRTIGTPDFSAGSTYTTYVTNPGATTQQSAYETILNAVDQLGFTKQQVAQLAPWAFAKAQAGENSTAIMIDLRNTPQYAQQFPGNVERIKQGLPPIKETIYNDYSERMMEIARAAGLPGGFVTQKEIGALIANNVSPTEFQTRISQGYEAVDKTDPAVRMQLQTMFGANPGHLAAYFLDPHRATDLIAQQVQAAKYGVEAQQAGLGQISGEQAMKAVQYAATDQLSPAAIRQGIMQAGHMEDLTGQAPGQKSASVTGNQLFGSVTGDASAKQAVDVAQAQRTAPFVQGGGLLATAKGVVGAGFASDEGRA